LSFGNECQGVQHNPATEIRFPTNLRFFIFQHKGEGKKKKGKENGKRSDGGRKGLTLKTLNEQRAKTVILDQATSGRGGEVRGGTKNQENETLKNSSEQTNDGKKVSFAEL